MGRRQRRHRHAKPPGRRVVLELLAGAGPAGCEASALLALGFTVVDLYALVRAGIAAPSAERVADGARELDLSRLWITEQGWAALAEATAASDQTSRSISRGGR
jgi:hypothetical protein